MLTSAEIAFLESQGLTEADVYDGRHQSSVCWKKGVRAAGKVVVLGSPCKKEGHRLRTRAGHCVQCDTKKLAYQKRYHSNGYVYIAGSQQAKALKIGTAVNIDQRQRNLRGHEYAGITDWTIIFYASLPNAGEIEQLALRSLANYQCELSYQKDGRRQVAGEVVTARLGNVMEAVVSAIGDIYPKDVWRSPDWAEYDFPRKSNDT